MKNLRDALFDDRVQGAAWLTAASLGSAVVAIIAVPVLTGIFTPDDFGALALVSAIAATLGTVVSGRYEMVCVVAPHDETGNAIARQGAIVAAGLSTVAAVLLMVASLVVLLGAGGFGKPPVVVFGIPILVALSGTAAAQALYDTRLGNYGVLSALTIARALGVVIAQVTWGLMDPSLAALIVPTILFSGVPLVRLIWLIRQNFSPKPLSYRAFLNEYRKYPIYQVPAAIANTLSTNITIFALGAAYGVNSVGIYSIATRVTGAPSTIITGPVNTVYFREAARLSANRKKSIQIYGGVVVGLLITGLLGFATLVPLANTIVGLLGTEWSTAKTMILATIPMGLALFIAAPANSALIAYGQQSQLLAWRIGLVLAPPLLIVLGPAMGWSDSVAIGGASMALLTGTIGYLLYGLRIVRKGVPKDTLPETIQAETN